MSGPFTPQPGEPGVHRMPSLPCPYCGRQNDAVTNIGGKNPGPPKDGDLSLCVQCGQPAVFVVGAVFIFQRVMTPEEQAEFELDHHELVAKTRKFIAEQGPG